jgi:hypothetical protein
MQNRGDQECKIPPEYQLQAKSFQAMVQSKLIATPALCGRVPLVMIALSRSSATNPVSLQWF